MNIDLESFIKETLLEIVRGVEGAQKESKAGTIVPENVFNSFEAVKHGISHIQSIQFELKVIADTSSSTGVKIGVIGGIIGGGAKHDSRNSDQVVSTLKFSVPLCLPSSGPNPLITE